MKKIFSTICLLLIVAGFAYAQNRTVKGTVRDSKGEPVVGAVVMLSGNTRVGTVSDAAGNWTLNVPKDASLLVSCISYVDQTVQVGTRDNIEIVLQEDAETLE